MTMTKDSRPSAAQRGYDRQWYKVRAMKLSQNPLCEECILIGIVKSTDMVHHIIPVNEAPHLRLAMDNLQSLCMDCHAVKHSNEPESKRLQGCDASGWPVHPDHPWSKAAKVHG